MGLIELLGSADLSGHLWLRNTRFVFRSQLINTGGMIVLWAYGTRNIFLLHAHMWLEGFAS